MSESTVFGSVEDVDERLWVASRSVGESCTCARRIRSTRLLVGKEDPTWPVRSRSTTCRRRSMTRVVGLSRMRISVPPWRGPFFVGNDTVSCELGAALGARSQELLDDLDDLAAHGGRLAMAKSDFSIAIAG